MDGLLLVNKKTGISSYDVIRKIKRVFKSSDKYAEIRHPKIGHAGTLDPFASGLLIVLVGKATKKMMSIHEYSKVYDVTAEFGYETDTQDLTGKIIAKDQKKAALDKGDILAVMQGMLGKQLQVPPNYSAKKVKGRRAYSLAREGKELNLAPKEIEVFQFELTDFSWPKISFRLEVSTGTYIRTIVSDLAKRIGRCATAVELRRVSIGPYIVEDAINVDSILTLKDVESNIIKI
ncbi:tRNA pseudouridine(55) synthase TruB [Candidatus Dojkabacteria bacterium]|uniref:tRNA pseudouridine synthase B n=1 Tax=Candidatus Dojkabacteria bacterium TaxID=2099670 RepID=A0A955KWY3_9BACT|nr:tRNA pseudouridine(55) synthase TruB [Candidatus Dojkabacteria bacterium]MCB9790736.1 tRNA pseudouridine(55) synthase TruB [Candidatus Nomurabacteria bacterium]